ncbi:hypothetical protein NDU88_004556 [Pleurodeles waltl]|uniref:Uncharacterized protein n=1 Tax=Pleurodeles waltl TaxID=8319 RepID=A0AAV7TRP8_PLEWA|nr:hypothetical protein NDU88_004556 [Pleurodeles waltl]
MRSTRDRALTSSDATGWNHRTLPARRNMMRQSPLDGSGRRIRGENVGLMGQCDLAPCAGSHERTASGAPAARLAYRGRRSCP